MTAFNTYLKEQKEKIKIVTLTEFQIGVEDGLSPTVKRIEEECKKKKIDHKIVFVRNSYLEERGSNKNNVYLGHINPITNKKELIEIDPNTVVIVRKAVSNTEKGLSIISILEAKNIFTINNRKSMEICNNKIVTTTVTKKLGIKNPKTVIISECDRNVLHEIMQKFNNNTYPVVAKTTLGEHGVGVMILDSFESLFSVLQTVWKTKVQVIIQEFIKSDYDIRAIVIDGKVIAAMERHKPKEEFRTNAAQGAKVKKHKMTPEEEKMALMAADAVYGYWIGCDIIKDNKGELYLLEVNTSAGTEGVEQASGENIVGYLIDHILDKKNWRRNSIEVGWRENAIIYDDEDDELKDGIRLKCKFDTGNGIHSSIHADNIKINGDRISFTIKGKKFDKKIVKRYKIYLGKAQKYAEHRVSTMFKISIGNRIETEEFFVTSRKGTLVKLEPILIGRPLINKFGFIINTDNQFMISEEPKEK